MQQRKNLSVRISQTVAFLPLMSLKLAIEYKEHS